MNDRNLKVDTFESDEVEQPKARKQFEPPRIVLQDELPVITAGSLDLH